MTPKPASPSLAKPPPFEFTDPEPLLPQATYEANFYRIRPLSTALVSSSGEAMTKDRQIQMKSIRCDGSPTITPKAAIRLLCLISLLFILEIAGHAQTSATSISFQGTLTGTDSQPVADGMHTVVMQFYDAPTGGNAVGAASTNNVVTQGGLASTALAVDPAVFDGSTRYLGVRVDGGNELVPRVLVTAVPYALNASAMKTNVMIGANGYIGIGTPTPQSHLDVAGDLIVGSKGDYGTGNITIRGPNGPAGGGSAIRLDFAFNGAGSATIQAYRGGGFDTALQILTEDTDKSRPVAIHVNSNGNVGILKANPHTQLDVNGTTRTKVLQITGGADLAEHLSVTDAQPDDEFKVEPGMVVSIDPTGNRKFQLANEPYDRKRVGIISGGNGVQPGLILRDEGNPHADGERPIALTGQVWCYADATFGSIVPGDLLTTSATPGHAMKVSDDTKARFAVLGQAITGLEKGRGWVQVLVGKQ